MTRRCAAISMIVGLGAGACGTQAREASAPIDASAEAQWLLERNMSGPRIRGMASCPSAVPHAMTRIEDTDEGVVVTVTSSATGEAREIRARARHLAAVEPVPGVVQHSGGGTGGGQIGYCPIVSAGTEVRVEDVAGGARVLVKARRPLDATTLQQITRARAVSLPGGK